MTIVVALLAYLAMCIALIFNYKRQAVPEIRNFLSVTPLVLLVASIIGGLTYGLDSFRRYYPLFLGMALISIAYVYVLRYIKENTEKENASAKQKVPATNKSNKTYKNEE